MGRLIFFFIGIFLLLNSASTAFSSPFKIIPVLSFNQTYNDNILFTGNDKDGDFTSTLSGKLLIKQKTQRLDARIGVNFDKVEYCRFKKYGSFDKFLSGKLDYKASERARFGITADYIQNSQIDSKLDTSGLVVLGDREAVDISGYTSFLFSEKTMGKLDLQYGKEGVDHDLSREDNTTMGVTMTFSKDLSSTFTGTKGLLSFGYLNFLSITDDLLADTLFTTQSELKYESDIWQVYTGFSKEISKRFSFYLQAGASYLETREIQKTRTTLGSTDISLGSSHRETKDSTFGTVVYTGLNYSGEKSSASIAFSHDIRGGTGTKGSVERSSVFVNCDQKITSDFSLTFKTSLYLNKNKRKTSSDLEELTFNVQPGFRYKISNGFVLSALYKATFIEDRQDHTSRNRNMFYINLTKNFDGISF